MAVKTDHYLIRFLLKIIFSRQLIDKFKGRPAL